MTREEKNWKIAEGLEPFNTLPTPVVVVIDEPRPSPLGAWTEEERYEDGDETRWYPRDFYTDEAANAMVLEKARFDLRPIPEGWLVGQTYMNGTITLWAAGSVLHSDRKTAICEAYLALLEAK